MPPFLSICAPPAGCAKYAGHEKAQGRHRRTRAGSPIRRNARLTSCTAWSRCTNPARAAFPDCSPMNLFQSFAVLLRRAPEIHVDITAGPRSYIEDCQGLLPANGTHYRDRRARRAAGGQSSAHRLKRPGFRLFMASRTLLSPQSSAKPAPDLPGFAIQPEIHPVNHQLHRLDTPLRGCSARNELLGRKA